MNKKKKGQITSITMTHPKKGHVMTLKVLDEKPEKIDGIEGMEFPKMIVIPGGNNN